MSVWFARGLKPRSLVFSLGTIKRTIFKKVRMETILKIYNKVVLPTFYMGQKIGIIRVAGFSLQHGYHSIPTTSNLQHTSNQEQYDQCGNSTELSQAPGDKPATRIPLQPNHIESPTHIEPRTIRPMW